MLKNLLCACVCLCLFASGLRAQSGDRDFVATARKTMQNYEKAVITLSAVLKIEVRGIEGFGEQERKVQCAAVVIDPSGLAVASMTNLIPHGKTRMGTRTVEVECRVEEVKYRLSDGSELPARVVLKDEDLDLAFLALQKPLDATTRLQLAAVPLGEAAAQVQPMDATILLGRTNEDLNYAPLLLEGRILAVLSQPRNCFVADGGVYGMPVFAASGKLVGLICRCVKNEGSAGGGAGRMQTVSTQLILPAADIARLVPQAKEEAKKAAEAEKKPGRAGKKKAEKKPADAEKPAETKKPAEAGK